MDKKQGFSAPALGACSLLTGFAVLCLTVFAVLSLSTAKAEQRLADASALAVTGYYAADCQAEEILAELRGGEQPRGVALEDSVYSYSCPVSDTQALEVKINAEDYSVLSWKLVASAEWEADRSMQLWSGGQLPG